MYLTQVEVKNSPIHGKGVFTLQKIQKGDIVWKFDPAQDRTISTEAFNALDKSSRAVIGRVAYHSPEFDRYVYPPEGDPSNFTNHDAQNNNLSAKKDKKVSEEIFFVANRKIEIGEELTVNYKEFDNSLEQYTPS